MLISIIVGSTRPNRFGIQPAEWMFSLSKKYPKATFRILDLEKIDLPFIDEATPPLMNQYTHQHTKDWSKMVSESDAFILVTPEYNHSFSAVLKNALDVVYHEWKHKPVALVSYGAAEGGTRAQEHLKPVLGYMGMYDLSEFVTIPNYWSQLDKEGKFVPSEDQEKAAHKLLEEIVFWTEIFQDARAKKAKS